MKYFRIDTQIHMSCRWSPCIVCWHIVLLKMITFIIIVTVYQFYHQFVLIMTIVTICYDIATVYNLTSLSYVYIIVEVENHISLIIYKWYIVNVISPKEKLCTSESTPSITQYQSPKNKQSEQYSTTHNIAIGTKPVTKVSRP